MEIVYSPDPDIDAGKREIYDPAYFQSPIPGATLVYCDEKYIRVTIGYGMRSIEVKPLSDLPKPKTKSKKGLLDNGNSKE